MIEPTLPQIARLLSFVLFLALGVRVACSHGNTRRRAVVAFVAYVIVISAMAGITQIDNWPFASYTLAAGRMRADTTFGWLAFRGVDSDGREWDIDPQSWSPVLSSILDYWIISRYPRLKDDDRRAFERFFVSKANESRSRLRAGRRIGFERLLGPLACGYWWRLPRARAVPDGQFRSIRVYRLEATQSELFRNGRVVRQTLFLEFPG